jgi:uncharacterized Tic20 family protein
MDTRLIKSIVLSWDFALALAFALVSWFFLPNWVSNTFAKDLYTIGINVLAIVFSVFFAALAIIISSSDNEFVNFLEEFGDYTKIISTFQISLLVLFIALIYSLTMYALTSAWIVDQFIDQPRESVAAFIFLGLWGLFAAFNSARDSITYSKLRAKFLTARHKARETSNGMKKKV